MRFTIILFLLIIICSPIYAAEVSNVEQFSQNQKFNIRGTCKGNKVTIQLFRNSDIIDYSTEQPCTDSQYELNDDLNYWKLPTGHYYIKVDDDETLFATSTSDKEIIISEPEIQPIETVEVISQSSAENNIEDAKTANEQNADSSFFEKVLLWLVEWFKTALVQINELITHKTTTDQLCLGTTCIQEQELQNLLQNTSRIEPIISQSEQTSEKISDEKTAESIKNESAETPDLPPVLNIESPNLPIASSE